MPRGQLPKPGAIRRNKPTIPTTNLPISGRKGPIPKPLHPLGPAGKVWWNAVWRSPNACGWAPGVEQLVSRRATMEDAYVAILASDPTRVAALASVMLNTDHKLGLTPKGLADLRWTVVDDDKVAATPAPAPPATSGAVSSLDARRARATGS